MAMAMAIAKKGTLGPQLIELLGIVGAQQMLEHDVELVQYAVEFNETGFVRDGQEYVEQVRQGVAAKHCSVSGQSKSV